MIVLEEIPYAANQPIAFQKRFDSFPFFDNCIGEHVSEASARKRLFTSFPTPLLLRSLNPRGFILTRALDYL